MANLNVKIVGEKLPGRTCGEYQDVHLGLQRGQEVVQWQSTDSASVRFTFGIVLREADGGGVDFRSPFVHGKPGERFFYLVWGDGSPPQQFGRVKLMLDALPKGLVTMKTTTLEGYLPLTKPDGKLVYASVRPPAINWSSS